MKLSLHDIATFALLDFEEEMTAELIARAEILCERCLERDLPEKVDVMVEDRCVVFEIEELRFKVAESGLKASEWKLMMFSNSSWVLVEDLVAVGRILRRRGYKPGIRDVFGGEENEGTEANSK